jgi:hypothetical protein
MVCQLSQGETKESGLFRKQNAHISENCSLECALQNYTTKINTTWSSGYYFVKTSEDNRRSRTWNEHGFEKMHIFQGLKEEL